MWIKQLQLKNFQSYKDETIEFHPNFNCIVGTGNSGKSAIVRALSFILFGTWDKSWIRHGATSAEVSLVTDSGIRIIREKGAKVNKYVVQAPGQKEQVYESFGTKVPEEIEAITKVFKVNVGDKDELNLNLSNQLDQLFLLSNTGSFKAKVLGHLSKAHYLDYALKNINKQRKSSNSEKSYLIKEQAELEEKLKTFDGLDDSKKQLEDLESRISKVSRLSDKLEKLKELKVAADKWKETYITEKEISKKLNTFNTDLGIRLMQIEDKYESCLTLRQNMTLLMNERSQLEKSLQTFTEERQRLYDKYVSLLKESNMCPTCFGTIEQDKIERVLKNA